MALLRYKHLVVDVLATTELRAFPTNVEVANNIKSERQQMYKLQCIPI